jgi:DNA adenine methylase
LQNKALKHRAFLKWAGGKYKLINELNDCFPESKTLIEPFVGAGSVFLNTHFESYILNDINADLIDLYQNLRDAPEIYVKEARTFFTESNNQPDNYYRIRAEFNQENDSFRRSVLFLYLNRFGYNGLCRYNQSGGFNVPFGRYVKPYFPEKELYFFAEKSQKATFSCLPFQQVMQQAKKRQLIYCDPPYAPISATANFTSYAKGGFGLKEQQELANLAEKVSRKKKSTVVISNHDTELTRDLYRRAELRLLKVSRSISQKGGSRKKVSELLAIYQD